MTGLSHSDLCAVAARWAMSWRRPKLVAVEPAFYGERPDIFTADETGHTSVFEVKVSRSDWLSDRKKKWRRPGCGLGYWRAFIAPAGLIDVDEVPDNWGLIEHRCSMDRGHWLTVVREPQPNPERNHEQEIAALIWLARRATADVNPGVWWKPYDPAWSLTKIPNGLPPVPEVGETLTLDLGSTP